MECPRRENPHQPWNMNGGDQFKSIVSFYDIIEDKYCSRSTRLDDTREDRLIIIQKKMINLEIIKFKASGRGVRILKFGVRGRSENKWTPNIEHLKRTRKVVHHKKKPYLVILLFVREPFGVSQIAVFLFTSGFGSIVDSDDYVVDDHAVAVFLVCTVNVRPGFS